MRRTLGLFVLSTGIVIASGGVIGIAVAVFAGNGFDGAFLVFLVVGLTGGGIIFAGLRLMRGATPLGVVSISADGWVGGYLANDTEIRQHDGRDYRVFYQTPVKGRNGRPSVLVVWVPAAAPTTLQFNRENRFDRWCKRLGIARECQTGDPDFDEDVYVRGPSDEFAERYLADPQKRIGIRALLAQGFGEVRLTGTDVEARWVGFDPALNDSPELVECAAEALYFLSNQMPGSGKDEVFAQADSRSVQKWLLWTVVIAFAATFVSVFVYPPIRTLELIFVALAVFIPVYVGFGIMSALLLRGTSTSHDIWGRLIGFGLVLLSLGSAGSVAAVNALAGEAKEEHRTLTITNKHYTTSRRGSKTYYAQVPAWDRPGDTLEFSVSSAEYDRIVPGRSQLELTTNSGKLGIEWLKSKQVRP